MTIDDAAFNATAGDSFGRRTAEHAAAYAVAGGVADGGYVAAKRAVYYPATDLPRATAAELAYDVLESRGTGWKGEGHDA